MSLFIQYINSYPTDIEDLRDIFDYLNFYYDYCTTRNIQPNLSTDHNFKDQMGIMKEIAFRHRMFHSEFEPEKLQTFQEVGNCLTRVKERVVSDYELSILNHNRPRFNRFTN